MTSTPLGISVVIATRNRPLLLADTVASICAGTHRPGEIVIVDQSDGDRAGPSLESTDRIIRHIRSATRGLSRARNIGATAARGPALAFTDDDMQADRGWLGALVGPLTGSGPATVVTGRVTAGPAEGPGGFVPATVTRKRATTFAGRLSIDVLAGGNMAIARDAFLRIGGFDPRLGPGAAFPAAEDNDLGYRLLQSGFRIIYVPDAELVHRAWRPPSDYLPLRFAYGRGKGGFYLKHARLNDWHTTRRMVSDVLRRGPRAARRIRHPRLALGELVYAAGVVAGAAGWMVRATGARESTNAIAYDEHATNTEIRVRS